MRFVARCFNPCCFGSVVPTRRQPWASRLGLWFQSLLFWISRSDFYVRRLNRTFHLVSILVVLDQSFRPEAESADAEPEAFQSLLFWISRSDHASGQARRLGDGFQSLLFWISRSDINSIVSCALSSGFNPCCFGSVVPTSRCSKLPLLPGGFNPCCFGSVVPTVERRAFNVIEAMFQSLLFWISRSDCLTWTPLLAFHPGFNPCCFGSVVPTTNAESAPAPPLLFQSLLFWISRSDLCFDVFSIRLRCFNPCCFGSVVPTP